MFSNLKKVIVKGWLWRGAKGCWYGQKLMAAGAFAEAMVRVK